MKPWKRQIELFAATKLASIIFPSRNLACRKIVSPLVRNLNRNLLPIYYCKRLHLRAKYDNLEDMEVVLIRDRTLTGNLINFTDY